MKRFGKYRDPRFALTTLQNPTWEVRTRAQLIQAAQEALADQPDIADISAPPLAAAPLLPPITTTEPDTVEFLATTPSDAPEPSAARTSPLPDVPDVIPVARPVPAKRARKPRSRSRSRAKKSVQPSVVLPARDAAPFVSKTLDRLITKAARANRHEHAAPASIDRHERKCAICRHPQRADLEEDFLDWRNPELLRKEYGIPHYRTIYHHARATGLYQRRRENLCFAAELFIEEVDNVRPGPDTVLRAINACARLNDRGEWIEPVKRVIVSSGGQTTLFAPTFQPGPAPEPHQLAPESCANPQFSAPASTSTDRVTPQILIDVPAIRKCRIIHLTKVSSHVEMVSVRMNRTDRVGCPVPFQSATEASNFCILMRVGSVVPSHNFRTQPGQSCAASKLACAIGRGRRIEAPHSHLSSISFNSFKSIVVTCFGVIVYSLFFVDSFIACRKSFLMDAMSFLLGTRFNSCFLPFSMRGSR